MGAALATLVIGGAFLATGIKHDQLNVTGFRPAGVGTTPPQAGIPTRMGVGVEYGPLTPAGQEVKIRLTPTTVLTSAQVRVTGSGTGITSPVGADLNPGRPLVLAVPVPSGTGAPEIVRVDLSAKPVGYQGLVVLPLSARRAGPITLSLVDRPTEEVLKALAPYLDRPVVLDGAAAGTVSLQVADAEPLSALQSLAVGLGVTLRREGDLYRLSR